MAYDYPEMSQAEIADYLDCSRSYVSQTLRDYDNQRAIRNRIEGFNQDLGFDSSNFDLGLSEPPQGSDNEGDDISLEELGPIGIVAISVIIGWIFFSVRPLEGQFWYFNWIIVAGCGVAVGGIGFVFYTKYQEEGIKQAASWFVSSFDSESNQKSSNTESIETTSPTPESLKNELYFERANQKCEWCDTPIDSPDVHHITPRSEGGPNDRDNLIVLCPNCHRKADNGIISRSKLRYKIKNKT